MFNYVDIFIPVSGCVVMNISALLCPGPIMLLRRPCNVLCHILPVTYVMPHYMRVICVMQHYMHVILIMLYFMRLILVKVVVFISTLAITRYFICINY